MIVRTAAFITKNDPPAIYLNKEWMDAFREQMREFFYDETKYDTNLEQLGVTYPPVRESTESNEER